MKLSRVASAFQERRRGSSEPVESEDAGLSMATRPGTDEGRDRVAITQGRTSAVPVPLFDEHVLRSCVNEVDALPDMY
jgi:hypothetical protein